MGTVSCSCSAIGALGKLLTEETGTATRAFDDDSIRHEFLYETLGTRRGIQHTNAITGSLAKLSSGAREHSYLSQGTIAVQPSPLQLTTWLPRIFGGAYAGANLTPTDILPSFDVLIYRENGIFQYTDAVVSQAILRGRTANGGTGLEFMELLINVVGKAELINDVTWPDPEPALVTTAASLPFTFWEMSLAIDSTDIPVDSLSMAVNNNLSVSFRNQQTPQCIRATGRDIMLNVQSPFTCANLTEALALNTAADSGALVLETVDESMSTEFNFPALRNTFITPTIPGKTEIPLKMELEAYATSAAREVAIVHDATA